MMRQREWILLVRQIAVATLLILAFSFIAWTLYHLVIPIILYNLGIATDGWP